jgi:peptide chain release factor 1
MAMFSKLQKTEDRFKALEQKLAEPDLINRQADYQKILKERSDLMPLVSTFREYKKILKQIEESKELISTGDAEMKSLASQELKDLEIKETKLEEQLKVLLLPKDPNDGKNIFIEIRGGTGGDEAALFAADLFRMYSKFAEKNRWKVEVASLSQTGIGGIKEVVVQISGKDVYKKLKYESGVHRVQRVPKTEAQGRIHTSTVTVAVLPEAEEVELAITDKDLRIDVYRSSGPGGQSVNTTDSAVRVTHIPTGLVVCCQDEKSQHKNKAKALSILRARLLEKMRQEQDEKIASERKSQIKGGERSDKIRTYNFPQGRLTDHRIGVSLYNLLEIMDGRLDDLVVSLITHFQSQAINEDGDNS